MKKNLIAGIIVSLAMTGMFGGVSFAADKAADAKPAVEVKADAKAEAPKAKKATKKKAAKKKVSKKKAAKAAAAPEAVK